MFFNLSQDIVSCLLTQELCLLYYQRMGQIETASHKTRSGVVSSNYSADQRNYTDIEGLYFSNI